MDDAAESKHLRLLFASFRAPKMLTFEWTVTRPHGTDVIAHFYL
jgi:hypothetical protein